MARTWSTCRSSPAATTTDVRISSRCARCPTDDALRSSGLYCFDRPFGDPQPHGDSVRYSLIVLLGLQRARAAGLSLDTDQRRCTSLCLRHRATFSPGDIGLALWADARRDGGDAAAWSSSSSGDLGTWRPRPARRSRDRLDDHRVGLRLRSCDRGTPALLDRLAGTGVHAPGTIGLYYHDAASDVPAAPAQLRHRDLHVPRAWPCSAAGSAIAGPCATPSASASTCSDSSSRRRLAVALRRRARDRRRAATSCTSVHQDAMAPMALLELAAVSGEPGLRPSGRSGSGLVEGSERAGSGSARHGGTLRPPVDPSQRPLASPRPRR